MKRTLAIVLVSASLVAGIGLPAWSMMRGADQPEGTADAISAASRASGIVAVPISGDEGVDHGQEHSRRRSGDGEDHDQGDDEDGDDAEGGNVGPGPAGSVAPPNNGLFGTGTAPKAQVN